jgi:hypothetical protein
VALAELPLNAIIHPAKSPRRPVIVTDAGRCHVCGLASRSRVPVVLHFMNLTLKVRNHLIATVYLADHLVDPGMGVGKLTFQFE